MIKHVTLLAHGLPGSGRSSLIRAVGRHLRALGFDAVASADGHTLLVRSNARQLSALAALRAHRVRTKGPRPDDATGNIDGSIAADGRVVCGAPAAVDVEATVSGVDTSVAADGAARPPLVGSMPVEEVEALIVAAAALDGAAAVEDAAP